VVLVVINFTGLDTGSIDLVTNKGILLPFVGKLEDAAGSSPTNCYHVRHATLDLAGPLWARAARPSSPKWYSRSSYTCRHVFRATRLGQCVTGQEQPDALVADNPPSPA
jgi:hypothetical protein